MSKTVLAIITDGEKVLIGKVKKERVVEMGGIQYVFPGGKVKEGEELDDAITRESREETGLLIKVKRLIHTRIHPVTQKEVSYFHCEIVDGELDTSSSDNDDIDSLNWVNRIELRTYMPTLNEAVEEYLKSVQ